MTKEELIVQLRADFEGNVFGLNSSDARTLFNGLIAKVEACDWVNTDSKKAYSEGDTKKNYSDGQHRKIDGQSTQQNEKYDVTDRHAKPQNEKYENMDRPAKRA